MKKISRIVLILFFILAGLNHFRNPEFYFPLIPDYLPYPYWINLASGVLEILLGVGLIPDGTRKMAAYALVTLLILFIPSHVFLIQEGGCVSGGLCVPAWVAWVRLVIVHPLLILWVWSQRK